MKNKLAESDLSLEKLRMELLSDVKMRNNREVVRIKMEKTFAYRRYEVVRDTPMIQDFQARWPALFEVDEVCPLCNLLRAWLYTLYIDCL